MMKITLEELKRIVAEMEAENISELELDATVFSCSDYDVDSVDFDVRENGRFIKTLFIVENI